ncbi:helix-turn-helix transcriptional regulator [bacterium]|nr:helix-turn-helix transcriptional regulator [bacterium]
MKLGNNLRQCRFEAGEISQEALAAAVDVSRQTIISLEKERYVPSTLLALKIASFFNKQVEDIFFLITGSEEE